MLLENIQDHCFYVILSHNHRDGGKPSMYGDKNKSPKVYSGKNLKTYITRIERINETRIRFADLSNNSASIPALLPLPKIAKIKLQLVNIIDTANPLWKDNL